MATRKNNSGKTAANLGFEAKLWAAADALRNNMDAAEYKHVVLGLIFLKYISDAFEAKHAELAAQRKQGPADGSACRRTRSGISNSPDRPRELRRCSGGS
jgi:type I restriction-modification system DNA methylase subunit